MLGKRAWWLGFIVAVQLSQSGCSSAFPSAANSDAADVPIQHPLRQYFAAQNPQWPVIKCVAGDVNHDGREDLIVFFQIAPEINRMAVVLSDAEGAVITNMVPAPVSRQQVQFRDIDNKPPLEFIVRGSKGNQAGLAIFRVTGTQLENLFGDGMNDCCN